MRILRFLKVLLWWNNVDWGPTAIQLPEQHPITWENCIFHLIYAEFCIKNLLTKIWPLFWVKNPFSWGPNHNHGNSWLAFAQVAKSVQILLFLSVTKPQVNGLHKNQPLLHIPTKRIFYHLRSKSSAKPQLALILSYISPLKRFLQKNLKTSPWDLKTSPCQFNQIYICTGEHIYLARKFFQKSREFLLILVNT